MASEHVTNSVLRVEGVGVTYPGGVVALRSTSVSFAHGEFTVLLGLSGAGKSTLLRTLNHLVQPSSGRVVSSEFGPLDARIGLRNHRRKTAMVFQHHQLILRHATAGAFPCRIASGPAAVCGCFNLPLGIQLPRFHSDGHGRRWGDRL